MCAEIRQKVILNIILYPMMNNIIIVLEDFLLDTFIILIYF